MKRHFVKVLLACMMGIMLIGCGLFNGSEDGTDKKETNKESVEEDGSADNNEEDEGEPSEEQEDKTASTEKEIYYIDSENGQLTSEEIALDELDEESVWKALQANGSVPESSNVISMQKEGDSLILDVDSGFGDYLRKQGTTGEYEILMCVVNSYLTAFDADKIKITEEGIDLMSSHNIYDYYFTMMEQRVNQ